MTDEILRCLGVLDLRASASAEDVKRAYRDLAKVWHPDRFPNDSSLHAKAQEKMKQINFAYERIQRFLESPNGTSRETEAPKGKERPREEAELSGQERARDQYNRGAACYNAGDINAALEWFLKAGNQGLADAQYRVGKVYYDHRRFFPLMGRKHFKECLFWFTKAAEQGHAEAQYMVGSFHQGSFGTPYNATEAKKWYALAAKQGHRKAKQRLSLCGFLWGYYEG